MSASPLRKTGRAPVAGRISGTAVVALLLLLVIPVAALSRLSSWIDWRVLAGVPVALSLCVYFSYRGDKRRAEIGAWRISESTLHLAELAGGWPGAFLAQRKFRHKISKTSYQVVFWLIILAHQCIALDFLLGGRLAKSLMHLAKTSGA